jgi:hypothetical protein
MMRVPRLSFACASCGNGFERYACQMTKSHTPYCSRACASIGFRRKVERRCLWCGISFGKHKSETERSDREFCSRGCYMAHRRANLESDNYPKIGPDHAHRIITEKHLGRTLFPAERVHHINEDKHDFAPENLAVFPSQSHHMRCHAGGMGEEELDRYRLLNMSAVRKLNTPSLFDAMKEEAIA